MVNGDTECERAVDPPAARFKNVMRHIAADALGNLIGLLVRTVADEDQKLLAAPTAYIPVLADLRNRDLRNVVQRDVAEIMPVSIVDLFEIVNIAHDERKVRVGLQRLFDKYLHAAAVIKPRQRIRVCELFQDRILMPQLRIRPFHLNDIDQRKQDQKQKRADRVKRIERKLDRGIVDDVKRLIIIGKKFTSEKEQRPDDRVLRGDDELSAFGLKRIAHIVADGDHGDDILREAKLPTDAQRCDKGVQDDLEISDIIYRKINLSADPVCGRQIGEHARYIKKIQRHNAQSDKRTQ